MKTIIVGVHGGAVQWITGIPDGIEVCVQDYDTDGVDERLLTVDDEGNSSVVTAYAGWGTEQKPDESPRDW